jgi:hypothetical protein
MTKMSELIKEIIDSLALKGSTRLGVLMLLIISMVGYQKLERIGEKLDLLSDHIIALDQQVIANRNDIGVMQNQITEIIK